MTVFTTKVPTPPFKQIVTKRTSLSKRDQQEDELAEYTESNRVTSERLCNDIHTHQLICPATSFIVNKKLLIQSRTFFSDFSSLFTIKYFQDLKFESYNSCVGCFVTVLSKICILHSDIWSRVVKAIRYLNSSIELDHRKNI